jgi:hypothetical protein
LLHMLSAVCFLPSSDFSGATFACGCAILSQEQV